ncbi:MAG: hypothetical protein MZU97_09120 [Bacillus subtilis]|nr:hypothetical protein [Bacillus subtilis]
MKWFIWLNRDIRAARFPAQHILTVLYFKILNHDEILGDKSPNWKNRDRFVLSKGHASPALCSVLAESGYIDKEELKNL